MSFDPNANRRRKVWINSQIQRKFTVLFLGFGLLSALTSVILLWLVNQVTAGALGGTSLFAIPQVRSVMVVFMFAIASIPILVSWLAVVLTHRVVGPIYVVAQYMGAIRGGMLPRCRPLRDDDELKGFYKEFQDTIESIRQRETGYLEQLKPLRDAASTGQALSAAELSAKLGPLVDALASVTAIPNHQRWHPGTPTTPAEGSEPRSGA